MTVLTEAARAASFILSEASGSRSRGNGVIAASMTILAGMVLGKVGVNEGAISVAEATFAGTGNGTLTLGSPAYNAGVQEGSYKVTLVEVTTDGGKFIVRRPDGTVDGQAIVGTAYNGQIKFTIADGSTDFSGLAEFTVAVTIAAAADEGRFKALDLAATDGAEAAAAIAIYAVTTGVGETEKTALIVRDAEVNGHQLAWPDGITTDQKNAAIAQLAALGIIVR